MLMLPPSVRIFVAGQPTDLRCGFDALPKGPLGQAIHYTLAQWEALNRFVSDGAIEIDNNVGENALRPLAVGRKNWLFLGNDEGGRRMAILY